MEETTTPRVVNMEANAQVSAGAFLGAMYGDQMRQCDIHDLLHIWASVEMAFARMPEMVRDSLRESAMAKYASEDEFDILSSVTITDQEADAYKGATSLCGHDCQCNDNQADATDEAVADGYVKEGDQ